MRVLVLSDIHANLTALEAVLADAGSVDAVWCLGDLVGYGAQPNEVVARMQSLPNLTCVLGNHDAAAVGKMEQDTFNNEARTSLIWTKTTITRDTRKFLNNLNEKEILGNTTLVHGSPRHPVWEYIMEPYTARLALETLTTRYGITGHTHQPIVIYFDHKDELHWEIPVVDQNYQLKGSVIFNPGSVGQPRDHDPRAAYAIFDPETGIWQPKRVKYDIFYAQLLIQQSGLPLQHAVRLAEGW